MFLGGFRSDMTGTKATALADFASTRGQAYLRFDYSGHGASHGRFEDGTIGAWSADALAVLDQLSEGPQILVGSSMGGWIMVLLALARPARVAGLVGLASAPDFTEALIWDKISAAKRLVLERKGFFQAPSAYDPAGYPITFALIAEGRKHLVLNGPIHLAVPVRLIHGLADAEVPWEMSHRLIERLETGDGRLTLVKDGDHRLSKPHEIDLMLDTLARLIDQTASTRDAQALAIGRIAQGEAERLLDAPVGDPLVVGIEAARHGAELGGLERHQRRRGHVEERAGEFDHLLRRRRLVIGQIVDAARQPSIDRRLERADDIFAMDAGKDLAGLDHALGGASANLIDDAAAGTVDPRQAEDVQGDTALGGERRPGAFRPEPRPAPRAQRPGWRRLVDPGPAPIAVDRGGREIEDALQSGHRPDVLAMAGQRHIARLAGGNRDQDMAGPAKRVCDRRAGTKAVEFHDLDARRPKIPALFRVPDGAADPPAAGDQPARQGARAIAETEYEQTLALTHRHITPLSCTFGTPFWTGALIPVIASDRALSHRILPATLIFITVLALAETQPARGAEVALPVDSSARYGKCMGLAESSPVAALVEADSWLKQGGSDGADYCAAVALITLGRYGEAGRRLDALGASLTPRNPRLAAGVLAEAGQAYTLDRDTPKALAAQSAALKLGPDDVELLLDRAVSLGSAGKYWDALDDLNHAHDLAPKRADILVLRAAGYRYLQSYELAAQNIAQALMLSPDDPDALVERGSLRKTTGDLAGARRDWVDAARIAGDTPAGDAARLNLELMDVKTTP